MSATNNNRSRESEIALLEKISTSLETFTSAPDQAQVVRYGENSSIRISSADASRDAIKNVLAAKTLVRSIVKVCAKEKLKSGIDDVLVDALVEEYQENYPSLTVEKVNEALSRYVPTETSANDPDSDDESDDGETQAAKSFTTTLGHSIAMIDEEMDKYYEKIAALKKSREQQQQATIAAQEEFKASSKKRKVTDNPNMKSPDKSEKPKKGRRYKNTPENDLLDLITSRYATERKKFPEYIPKGTIEDIVEQAKKDMGMEDFDMPLKAIATKVRMRRLRYFVKEDSGSDNDDPVKKKFKMERALFDEVYTRYSSEKEISGGTLPTGTLDTIIDRTKADMGMTDSKVRKGRIRQRFKREHPHFENNHSSYPEIRTLSEETKKKRQQLFNEITARYAHEREIHKGKLPDGTLDLIISSTKNDLEIHDIEVPKGTIWGRLKRKSIHVLTLGKESPYDAIDVPLIQTINNWLEQGISVTRDQGLELANSLLRGKKLNMDSNNNVIELDARWWRNFLDRNKRCLACAVDEDE